MYRMRPSVVQWLVVILVITVFSHGSTTLFSNDFREASSDLSSATFNSLSNRVSSEGKDQSNLIAPIRKRIITKLKKIVRSVQSINRSLKEEIEQLKYGGTLSSTNDKTTYGFAKVVRNYQNRMPIHTQLNSLLKNYGVRDKIIVHSTRKMQGIKQNMDIQQGEVDHKTAVPLNPFLPDRSVSDTNCSSFQDYINCSRLSVCRWCPSDQGCTLSNKLCQEVQRNQSHALYNNISTGDCNTKEACHLCVESVNCVWCESTETCLAKDETALVTFGCANRKWFWRSCAYDPPVFLIALPVLLALVLVLLFALALKYYLIHRRRKALFISEEHIPKPGFFKFRNKPKIYACGGNEKGDLLTEKIYNKYQIVDHRKKKRPETFGPSGKEGVQKSLGVGVKDQGKKRAESFGPPGRNISKH